jgi:transposase
VGKVGEERRMNATDLNARLRKLGLKKHELAKILGVSADTAYRWKDKPPQYVLAWLEAMERAKLCGS